MIDQVYFLGTSERRQSRVLEAVEKKTNKAMAIRHNEDENFKRPHYDQWIQTKILNEYQELMPCFDRNFNFCIGDPDISFKKQLKLMNKVAQRLKDHHSKGRIHGNVHDKNVLLSSDLDVIEFMDSLPQGNLNTYYSSPEN